MRRLLARLLTFSVLSAICACGDPISSSGDPISSNDAILARIAPEGGAAQVLVGYTLNLTALGVRPNGDTINLSAQFSSSNTNVLTVSAAGVALGVAPGTATVTAVANSNAVSLIVTVVAPLPPGAGFYVWPDTNALTPGLQRQLEARTRGSPVANSIASQIDWSSSDATVASVDASGNVTAVAPGAATIAAQTPAAQPALARVYVRDLALRFVDVAVDRTVCALTDLGEVYCWGSVLSSSYDATEPTDRCEEWYRATGGPPGSTNLQPYRYRCSAIPARVVTNLRFTSIGPMNVSGYFGSMCGIATDTNLYCWFRQIARSGSVTGLATLHGDCALTATGAGFCMQVAPAQSTAPVAAPGNLVWRQLSGFPGGGRCGVASDDLGYCWGKDVSGSLGLGAAYVSTTVTSPTRLASNTPFAVVLPVSRDLGPSTFADAFMCALSTTGETYCSGKSPWNGQTTDTNVPTVVAGAPRFTQLDVGTGRACGLTSGGELHCWGDVTATSGQSLAVRSSIPTRSGPTLALQKVALGKHTARTATAVIAPVSSRVDCAIATDGIVYCWGTSAFGDLGDGIIRGPARGPVRVLGQR